MNCPVRCDNARSIPAVAGKKVGRANTYTKTHANVTPVDLLLSRLDGVRRTGKGWIARCPAHEDKRASLSIVAADDGRVLIHDFAGCRAADVVAAVGLELGDLFPQRFDASPMARAQRREYAKAAHIAAAIGVIGLEARIVTIAAGEMLADKVLNFDDYMRLARAEQRIADALEELR